MQGLHSLVAQDKGLHIQAEGLVLVQKHLKRYNNTSMMEKTTEHYVASTQSWTPYRSAEGGILACQAEVEAAAGAQWGLVGLVEAGGCSGPWKWEASGN